MPYKHVKDKRANAALYRARNRKAIRARANSPKYVAMRKVRIAKLRKNPKLHEAFKAWERSYRKKRRMKIIGRKKRCDICKRIIPLKIDHDHVFAKTHCNHGANGKHCKKCRRGRLCGNCNTALGKFQDNLLILGNGRAGRYIKKWKTILTGENQ
ncbi:MAG: hypothetical protein C5B59_07115 [Bacteroidetes bacterium]|nr:MAG: hypothetical protein C5B59_07115 [Bacteroidota bacterium]